MNSHLPKISQSNPTQTVHKSNRSGQPLQLPSIQQNSNFSKKNWADIYQLNNVISSLKKEFQINNFTTFNKIIRNFNSWENDLQGVFVFGDDLNPRTRDFESIMTLRHNIMRLLIEGRQKLGNSFIIKAIKDCLPNYNLEFLKRGDLDKKGRFEKKENYSSLTGIDTPTKYRQVGKIEILGDRGFAVRFSDNKEEISVIAPKAPGSQELTSDVDYTIRCQNLDLLVKIIEQAEKLFIAKYGTTMSEKLDLSLYPPNLEFPDLPEHLKTFSLAVLKTENELTALYELITGLAEKKELYLLPNKISHDILGAIDNMKQKVNYLTQIGRSQAYIHSLRNYLTLHKELSSGSSDLSEDTILKYIMARFESLVYVSGAYQNREAIKHVVYGMQSNKQNDGIKYEYSILQNIGSLLLHIDHDRKASVPLGRTLWRTAKYSQRITDALWRNTEVSYKDGNRDDKQLASDLAKVTWPLCPELDQNIKYIIASILLTNMSILRATKKFPGSKTQTPYAQHMLDTQHWDRGAIIELITNIHQFDPAQRYPQLLQSGLSVSRVVSYNEKQRRYFDVLAASIYQRLQ